MLMTNPYQYVGNINLANDIDNYKFIDNYGDFVMEEVVGDIDFRGFKGNAPYLKLVTGYIDLRLYQGDLSNLIRADSIVLDEKSPDLLNLEIINGNLEIFGYEKPLPKLKIIGRSLEFFSNHNLDYNINHNGQFNNLEEVGYELRLDGLAFEFPKLKSVGGALKVSDNITHLKFCSDFKAKEILYPVQKHSITKEIEVEMRTIQIDLMTINLYIENDFIPKLSANTFWIDGIIKILKINNLNWEDAEAHLEITFYGQRFWIDQVKEKWNEINALSIDELFQISSHEVKKKLFEEYHVERLINELNPIRIKSDGIQRKYKRKNLNGQIEIIEKYNIYETFEVLLSKDSIPDHITGFQRKLFEMSSSIDKAYLVKCWCTTTEKEHWLWISPDYIEDPLAAIASTFIIHENIIPHIKALKRQGDILIAELKENIKPLGFTRGLRKEEYFNLLVDET